MPNLLEDANGIPVPQYLNEGGTAYEQVKGASGAYNFNVKKPVKTLGTEEAVSVSLREPTAGAALPGSATYGIKAEVSRINEVVPAIDAVYGLKAEVSRINTTVNVKDVTALGAVVSAGTGVITTGTPNDTTVFPDITGNVEEGVQVYLSSTANIVALIIEAKIDSVYYPLLVVAPNTLATKLSLAAFLSPRVNGVLTSTWRISAVTETATTPTIIASYQYIS